MLIDQRNNGASATISVGLSYLIDRFYSFASGAAITGQRVSSGRTDFSSAFRITGASGNTYAEIGQRIESFNSSDLVGGSVTVSFLAARSSGTSLTVRISYANASDNFSTVTSVATQAVTLTSTLAQYTVTFTALPSQVANGIQLGFEFGALGAGVTATVTGVQLEAGSVATPFEQIDYGRELIMCQRYYIQTPTGSVIAGKRTFNWSGGFMAIQVSADFPVTMRATPSMTVYGDISDAAQITLGAAGMDISTYTFSAFTNISNAQHLDLHYYIANAEL
jgi:hypothetical protein